MLTEFTIANFKSYKKSRLPLGSLTVLIGANAAGKSNAIEALRFLSWLAQGQKLTTIQYAVNHADRIIRGRVDDLCHLEHSSFTIGCHLDSTEWNQLDITLNVREGELHISSERIIGSTTQTTQIPLYDLNKPSQGIGTDVDVSYNNFTKGKNKPRVICRSMEMSSICLIDTSIFLNFLNVPNCNQDRELVLKDYQIYAESGCTFLLPMAAIIETGNHIAQNGDGTIRRKTAMRFVAEVKAALKGEAPWSLNNYHSPVHINRKLL